MRDMLTELVLDKMSHYAIKTPRIAAETGLEPWKIREMLNYGTGGRAEWALIWTCLRFNKAMFSKVWSRHKDYRIDKPLIDGSAPPELLVMIRKKIFGKSVWYRDIVTKLEARGVLMDEHYFSKIVDGLFYGMRAFAPITDTLGIRYDNVANKYWQYRKATEWLERAMEGSQKSCSSCICAEFCRADMRLHPRSFLIPCEAVMKAYVNSDDYLKEASL